VKKSKRLMLLSSVLGIMVAISAMTMIRTASAMCVCACVFDCSDHTCHAEFDGDSAADCVTCVIGCCKAAAKAEGCPIN